MYKARVLLIGAIECKTKNLDLTLVIIHSVYALGNVYKQ